jgi:hypothetical protein
MSRTSCNSSRKNGQKLSRRYLGGLESRGDRFGFFGVSMRGKRKVRDTSAHNEGTLAALNMNDIWPKAGASLR